jgi:hypothetical protein
LVSTALNNPRRHRSGRPSSVKNPVATRCPAAGGRLRKKKQPANPKVIPMILHVFRQPSPLDFPTGAGK